MVSSRSITDLLTRANINKYAVLLICAGAIYILISQADKQSPWSFKIQSGNFIKSEDSSIKCSVYEARLKHKETNSTTVYNCSVLEFLATVDPTARGYDSDLVCDELSDKYDIVCRLYLRQIGFEYLMPTICLLDNLDKVPRIVYYVIFGPYKFRFLHYVSMVAAKRFLSPRAIYVIGDQHPTGKWWQEVLKNVHGVRYVYRELPGNVSGKPPAKVIHLSDIIRLQVLYLNGGIYLDADMVVLKDPEPLLDHDITLGLLDNVTGMGNAFIAAKRRKSFIHEWYSGYLKYKNQLKDYYWNSLKVPRDMWLKNNSRVHMISDKLYRPNWYESHLLFNSSGFPWQNSMAVHIWSASKRPPDSPEAIQTANTTVAEIFRYVLYGDPRIRKRN